MVGWLKSAVGLLSGAPGGRTEVYRRNCTCGEPLQLQRTKETQRRSCPRCGTRFIVLPVSPFRRPKPPKGYVPKDPPPEDLNPDISEPPVDQFEERAGRSGSKFAATEGLTEPVALTLEERVPLGRRIRRQFTRVRMTIAAVILLIVTAGYVYWWRTRMEWARENYTVAVVAAYAALGAEKTEEAAKQFSIASQSAGILDLEDAQSLEVRQYDRELGVLDDLSLQSFPDLIDSLTGMMAKPEAGEFPVYRQYSGGDWFVLDVYGKVTQKEGSPWLVVTGPVKFVDEPFEIHIPLPEYAVTDRPTNALNEQRFLLATRSDYFAPKGNAARTWILHCDSTFLWEHVDSLKLAGLFDDDPDFQDELRELLQLQTTKKLEAAPAAESGNQARAVGGES
ncbi:MAG: hypothetical protein CMJ46_11140 [Planctomyces sp.]|nr:hypothetical protein [Planctomyces sp.]